MPIHRVSTLVFYSIFLSILSAVLVGGSGSLKQNKIEALQRERSDNFIHHQEKSEYDQEEQEQFLLDKEPFPGDPHGPEHSLEYGAACVKSNSKACIFYPEVGCIWVEDSTYVCRCDFQHTWNETKKICVPNVFAPCIQLSNTTSDCGQNMDCRPDRLGLNPNEKMCRCRKGFMVKMDLEGLPSSCVIDPNFAEDDNQVIPMGHAPSSLISDPTYRSILTLVLTTMVQLIL